MNHGKYQLEKTWNGWSAKISKPDAEPLLKRSFPAYRGRKFRITFCDSFTFSDVNWSGGSHNDYVIIRNDGQARKIDDSAPPWAQPLEGHTQTLTPEFCIVEHTRFCGTYLGIRFYFATALLAEWQAPDQAALPAPAAQIESPSVY